MFSFSSSSSFSLINYIKFIFILQSEHDGSDVQVHLNVEHPPEADILPNMTRSPRVKYITYFEDSESLPGKRTAVWELDKGISNIVPFEFQFFFGCLYCGRNSFPSSQQIILIALNYQPCNQDVNCISSGRDLECAIEETVIKCFGHCETPLSLMVA